MNKKKLTMQERLTIIETKMDIVLWIVRLLLGTNFISVVGLIIFLITKN